MKAVRELHIGCAQYEDSDGDMLGDNADPNIDGDLVRFGDRFPLDPTEAHDSDGDGIGDNTDANTDTDADGVDDGVAVAIRRHWKCAGVLSSVQLTPIKAEEGWCGTQIAYVLVSLSRVVKVLP